MEYLFRKYAYETKDGIVRFWIGPVPIIFLCRPRSVKVVLESHTLLWKPPEYTLLEPIWGSGLITSSGPKWHQRRRMLTPAFHFTILQSYLDVFNSQAKTMVNILDEFADGNETIDLLPYLRRFSMDTISETAMGVSVNAQKGENHDFYMAITRIFELLFKNLRYPWLWAKPIWYMLGYGFEFDRHVNVVRKLVTKVIAKRTMEFESLERKPTFEELSIGGKKKLAFLDLLLSMQKEHKLTDADIAEEVGTFLVAGYDTVSSSIGFVLFLLGHKQHIQDKVYEELYEIFGESDRAITVDDLRQMKYLNQCMKESIRMYPTVVMIGRRITEDTIIGKIVLCFFLLNKELKFFQS
uniref:Cytochrome P450 n=1 Tax=Ascaris lumbricoides TaxID=6252 RepID=A0A0M3I4W9_ASCLU